MTMLVFAIALEFLLLPEWEVESLEQCSAVTVIDRRCRNRDVHAPDLIDLVVLDLGENDLFLHAQAVVALAVERARRDAAEVADAGHRNVDQPVEELVHANSTQRDLRADRESRTQLEGSDRLARFRDERHLHRVLDLEVFPQARYDSRAVKFLQPGHKFPAGATLTRRSFLHST